MKNIPVITIAPLLIVLSACGYTFQGSGSVLPPEIKNIYIPQVENATAESGLTNLLTEELRDRFSRYGVVELVDNESDADATLKVKLNRVDRETRSVTSNTDTALQYESVLVLSGELKAEDGRSLWKTRNMKVSRSVGTTGDTVVSTSPEFAAGNLSSRDLAGLDTREIFRGQEKDAFQLLAQNAARKIYDDAVAPDF